MWPSFKYSLMIVEYWFCKSALYLNLRSRAFRRFEAINRDSPNDSRLLRNGKGTTYRPEVLRVVCSSKIFLQAAASAEMWTRPKSSSILQNFTISECKSEKWHLTEREFELIANGEAMLPSIIPPEFFFFWGWDRQYAETNRFDRCKT